MNSRKPGRPTDSVKDSIIKLRVSKELIEEIDEVANQTNSNRSEMVREILPIISSKDYESMISLSALGRLEQYSEECSSYFETFKGEISTEEISEKFPAFVSTSVTPPTLFIKYPTYKVRAISSVSRRMGDFDVVESILKDVKNISQVYYTQCFMIEECKSDSQPMYLPEVMCLAKTLEENIEIKDQICSLLKSAGIKPEVWPAYSIIGQDARIITRNGKDYVVFE